LPLHFNRFGLASDLLKGYLSEDCTGDWLLHRGQLSARVAKALTAQASELFVYETQSSTIKSITRKNEVQQQWIKKKS
jgi:hypothetical protein